MLAINSTLLSGVLMCEYGHNLIDSTYYFKMLVPVKNKQIENWPYIQVNCSEKVFDSIKEFSGNMEVLVEGSLNIPKSGEISLYADSIIALRKGGKDSD